MEGETVVGRRGMLFPALVSLPIGMNTSIHIGRAESKGDAGQVVARVN